MNIFYISIQTLRNKLLLEEALALAEAKLANLEYDSKLQVNNESATLFDNINAKELQVSYNGKVIFTLATIQ